MMQERKRWAAWLDPTDELKSWCWLIERCQNLLGIGLNSHRPGSGCPCWLRTTERANNGHDSIRTGTQSNGRRRPLLMNDVFFYRKMREPRACFFYCDESKFLLLKKNKLYPALDVDNATFPAYSFKKNVVWLNQGAVSSSFVPPHCKRQSQASVHFYIPILNI